MKNKNTNSNSKIEKKPTKEKIFDVALDLFSQKGFDAVSVREIAREVGIRESSIYNHYKSKEAILDAIIDYLICTNSEKFIGLGGSTFSVLTATNLSSKGKQFDLI